MKRLILLAMAAMAAGAGALAAGAVWVSSLGPEGFPAPAISTNMFLNEKFRFLRNRPEFDPQILVVGSSLSWRQIDGAVLEPLTGGPDKVLNGATGYLAVHQTRDLMDFYLDHYRNVRTVIVAIGPPDLSDCTNLPAEIFHRETARQYVFGEWPEPYFYARFFKPRRYMSVARNFNARKQPPLGDLFIDSYGAGPREVPAPRELDLEYSAFDPDPACTSALIGLSDDLAARAIELVVVFSPVHPQYRKKFPEVGEWIGATARQIKAATAGKPVLVLMHYDDSQFAASDFRDAMHLQWHAVGRFSHLIADAMSAKTGKSVPTAFLPWNSHQAVAEGGGTSQDAAAIP